MDEILMLINYHTSNLMYQISVCQVFSPNYMKENSSSNHLHLLNFALTCKLAAGNAINNLSSYTKFNVSNFSMSKMCSKLHEGKSIK